MMRFLCNTMMAIWCCFALCLTGCSAARSRHDPEQLRMTPRPAHSLAMHQTDMIVAVSPVRQTMQIGGSIPTLLGAGISAVQDSRHGKAVRAALGGYDPHAVFEERLERRIAGQFSRGSERVAPPGTSAGFANEREARRARLEGLRRAGYTTALDLELSFGIYGPQGILALKVAGELFDIQTGRLLWRDEVAWYSVDLFADMRWRDPMQRMTPNITAPRLSVADDAVGQWTRDNAAPLRVAFEQATDDIASAVVAALGLDETPEGLYTLGAHLLLNRKYAAAAEKFTRALELAPGMTEAVNGLAVALAKKGQVDAAIALNKELAEVQPDFMPGQYNLAWWHAMEKKNPEQARPYYEKAVALGVAPNRRLERAMKERR
mgnify:CR=1 FL=1